jgi:hypothetical protein
MRASLCLSIGAVVMFYAGYAYADRDSYTVVGSLHISSDGPDRQICELRIGNATDAKKKILLVSTPGMVLAADCRTHAGEHASLTLRFGGADFAQSDRREGRP